MAIVDPKYVWVLDAPGAVLHVDGKETRCSIVEVSLDDKRKTFIAVVPFDHEVNRKPFDTMEAAQVNIENAYTDILHTPREHRYASPFHLRIEDLERTKGLIKVKKLAELAGLSASSIAQKVGRGTQLTIDESEAMTNVLRDLGVVIERRSKP